MHPSDALETALADNNLDGEPRTFHASPYQLPQRNVIRIVGGNTDPFEEADEGGAQLRGVVGPVPGALYHHIFEHGFTQPDKGGSLSPFDVELQESSFAVVGDEFFVPYLDSLQLTLGMLDRLEERNIAVLIDDDRRNYHSMARIHLSHSGLQRY